MRMVDFAEQRQVRDLGVYLTQQEAEHLVEGLGRLLRDPEASEHLRISDFEGGKLSCSIVTDRKLKKVNYNYMELKILGEKQAK